MYLSLLTQKQKAREGAVSEIRELNAELAELIAQISAAKELNAASLKRQLLEKRKSHGDLQKQMQDLEKTATARDLDIANHTMKLLEV